MTSSTIHDMQRAARAADEATNAREQARAARDAAIQDARASGSRPVQLAAAAGLSRSTVHAAIRAAQGTARGGDPLARVQRAAEEWRAAKDAERAAHDARNVAIARALDGGQAQPADVRAATGWAEARVYQARDEGRALIAAQDATDA